jgi:hypothetical protein
MQIWRQLAVLGVAVTACGAPSDYVYINLHTADCPEVYGASLIEVALHPRRYVDHCIGVSGFYQHGQLYLSSEDAQHNGRGVLALAVSEEPKLAEPHCDGSRLFLAGPLNELPSGAPILLPQHARQPGAEGAVCLGQ